MYNVGDTIIYTTYGVCKIKELVKKEFNGTIQDYYLLIPVKDTKSQVFVPTDNEIVIKKLHKLLSKNEVMSLIQEIPNQETYWIDNENDRKKHFSDIIRFGNRLEVISIIKSIYAHQKNLREKNKKLHMCDEQVFKEAENLIYDEFSYVLQINKEEVIPFISKQIDLEM